MSEDKVPRFPFRLLSWFCPEYLYEEIEGDLIQKFSRDEKSLGEGRAKRRLLWNVMRFFRPGIILRNKPTLRMPVNMIKNYVKVAFRVMLRNRSFSIINIAGLTLGITAAILIFLWVSSEFTYDRFHANADRIYKVWNRSKIDGEIRSWDHTPRVLAPTLKEEYSAIESAVSYGDYSPEFLFTAGDTKMIKNTGVFTDPEFLTMFSFPLLKGNSTTALVEPASIVVTESFAHQLFGDKEAFGETVTIWDSGNGFPFTITGVMKDLPANTDFHFEYLIPFKFIEDLEGKNTDWNNNSASTFITLRKGADATSLDKEIKDITIKHTQRGNSNEVFLYPLTKMRLYSRFENGIPVGGKIEIMRMLALLGAIIVLIACINFVNLSTARAQKRAREVGVRKVTGANRFSLVMQFICESLVIAVIAGMISLIAVYLLLPAYNTLISKQLTLDFGDIRFWGTGVALIFFIGILAGSYPAFYLSSFQPVRVLKGGGVTIGGRNLLRKTLVVFQFGFALTLIFSTLVVYRQINYVQHRDAGYAKDNLVYQMLTGDLGKNYVAYKNELLQSGIATSVTKTGSPITQGWSNTPSIEWEGKDPQSSIIFDRFFVDDHITQTAGVKLTSGRDMDLEKFPSDSSAVLINEAAAKVMGFKNPIGEIIKDGKSEWHIVGVLQDFILASPTQRVQPMVLQGGKGMFAAIHIRFNENRPVQENIAALASLFAKYNPSYPFDYHFVDQEYERKFDGIGKTLTLTTFSSSIAIFIACLGLLGLSTYMIETRVKEIGIRKVMGASATSITRLLCGSSLKPIIIAVILHSPLAWLSMQWYLQSFEYRITMSPWLFLGAAGSILSIAILTVGLQTLRAANADPVKSLRNE